MGTAIAAAFAIGWTITDRNALINPAHRAWTRRAARRVEMDFHPDRCLVERRRYR
jgi:hypothetical protein